MLFGAVDAPRKIQPNFDLTLHPITLATTIVDALHHIPLLFEGRLGAAPGPLRTDNVKTYLLVHVQDLTCASQLHAVHTAPSFKRCGDDGKLPPAGALAITTLFVPCRITPFSAQAPPLPVCVFIFSKRFFRPIYYIASLFTVPVRA